MKTTVYSTRIEEKYAKEIAKYAEEDGLDKSTFLKKLIVKGLSGYKLEHAVELYNNGRISLSKAAEIADISLYELISLMPEKNMELNYTTEDLIKDLQVDI